MTTRFGAVCLQLGPRAGNATTRQEVKEHLDYFCQMIDFAMNEYTAHSPLGVKLIVGPEQALLGWPSTSAREMHEKYAIEIPGPETERLIEKASEYDCYLSPGSVVERDPESCAHLIFNTQLLVGPSGVLYRYRKVQPWLPLENAASPHDLLEAGYDTEKYPLFPVVETEIGRLGGFICYDALFPEIARQLALGGCEIFLGSTAWMDPFGRPPLDWWTVCCRARSIENMAYGIYTGSGVPPSPANEMPTSGGSFICDYEGRILAQSQGSGEAMTYATLDIDALRDHRQHDRGNNVLAHLRIGVYDYWQKTPGYTPQTRFRDAEELTLEECDELGCREMERFWSDYYREDITVPRRRPPHWGYSWGPGSPVSEEPAAEA
jgi:predicted amidohydrolase